MTATPLDEESIFDQARKIESPEERSAFLEKACGDNTAMLERVRALLDVNDQQADFLESPPSAVDETVATPTPQERPGTVIGRYKLMEQIGEGGFGVVYVAEQEKPIRRKVALKVIKPGMDTKEVIARFEAERQALALMDHPNIAKVLDAGTTESGHPFFVMEYVRGMPITDYCDAAKMDTRSRLELFVSVCQAIQHAHQKGVIHRDIKPSNVLITEHDGTPVPKVIDFGVAKAIHQRLTERTIYTRHQQIVGTPLYMSPEQAELSGIDIDTRTDVYSLGVLLYELLTGTTPFDRKRFDQAAYAEICRIIREELPPKPSTKISTLGERSGPIAAARKSDRYKLRQLICGDLDWIAMRAIEKDRTRRYETANGFANDILRYLNNEPVLACPPSAAYRFSRFIRRNRSSVAVAAALLAVMCVGLIGTTLGLISARSSARRLSEQLKRETVSRLTAQSESIRRETPIRSLLLAMEAVDTTRREDGTVLPIAHESLASAVQFVGGQPLVGGCNIVGDAAGAIAISRDSRRLAIGDGSMIRIWDLTAPDIHEPLIVLEGHRGDVLSVAFGPDSRFLVSGSSDTTCRLWDLSAREPASAFTELSGHHGPVKSVVISHDGRWIATAGFETIVWDLTAADPSTTPRVLCELEESVRKAVISSDSRWLVTCGSDHYARLFNLSTDDPAASEQVLSGHTGLVTNAAFSPDNKLVATVSWDGTARLWNLDSQDPAKMPVVLESRDRINAVCFSPNGRWLLTGNYDKTASLWDLESDDPNAEPRELIGHNGWVSAVSISGDGRWAITGSYDRTARIWDISTDDSRLSSTIVARHDAAVLGIATSDDGRWCITADRTNAPRVKKLSPRGAPSASPYVLTASRSGISNLMISPNGQWLVTFSRKARLWDLRGGNPAESWYDLDGFQQRLRGAAISSDSRWLVTTGEGSTALLWDLTQSNPAETPMVLDGHDDSVISVTVSDDGRWLGTSSVDGTARIWDLNSANIAGSFRVLRGHQGPVNHIWIGTGGDLCITMSEAEKKARVWDLTAANPSDGPRVIEIPLKPSNRVMFASKDQRWLVIPADGGDDGRLMVWDLDAEDSAAPRVVDAHKRKIFTISQTTEGDRLVTGSWDKTARIWDLSASDPWASSAVLRGHKESVHGVALSQDGQWLATSSADLTVRLWDMSGDVPRNPSLVLRGPERMLWSVGISPYNRWVISCSRDDTVRLWDLNTESLYDRARQLVGRDLSLEEREEYQVRGK